MLFKTVALLTLSATTFAHPGKRGFHSHSHHHHKWGTGAGGIAAPTGGAFEQNGTVAGATEAGSSSAFTSVITQTVVPVAASSSSPAAAEFFAASSSAADPVAPEANGEAPVTAEDAATSSCTSTSTFTSINYVTMTISSGTSTSTVPAGGNVQAFQQSTTATSSSSAADSPAGFFQGSSFGGFSASSAAPAFVSSMSFGGFSSPSSGPATTFATSVASSSAPASSSAAPASGGSTSGKKGLSYNSASLTDAFAGTGMTWAYNWAASQGGTLVSGVEYVPMLWGLDATSSWSSAAGSAISSGSNAALSFNEPDLSTQSNIDPVTAAKNHIQYMNPLSVKVGSPAVTNGAGTNPLLGIDWLNAFFTACAGNCKVDFVAFHWYADASDTDYFKSYVGDVIGNATAAGVSKVWLTEFGTTGGDTESFLQEVLPFLDETPEVERYAFFMCANPQTLTGTSLNSVGQAYASTT